MCDKSSKRYPPSKISLLTSSLKRFGSVCYAACGWAHCGWLQAAETPGESAERSQAKQGDRLQGGHAATGKQQVWRGRKAPLRPRGFVCMKEVSDGASVSPQVATQHGNEKLPGSVRAWCSWRRSCRQHRHGNVRTYIFLTGRAESQLRICHQPLVIPEWFFVVDFTNLEGAVCPRLAASAWALMYRTSEGSRSSSGSLQDRLLLSLHLRFCCTKTLLFGADAYSENQ